MECDEAKAGEDGDMRRVASAAATVAPPICPVLYDSARPGRTAEARPDFCRVQRTLAQDVCGYLGKGESLLELGEGVPACRRLHSRAVKQITLAQSLFGAMAASGRGRAPPVRLAQQASPASLGCAATLRA